MKSTSISFVLLSLLCACNSPENKPDKATAATDKAVTIDSTKSGNAGKLTVCNQLDPICGMTTADGYEDTALIKGEVYGFCSWGCKAKFLKQRNKKK